MSPNYATAYLWYSGFLSDKPDRLKIKYYALLETKINHGHTLEAVQCWVARGNYDNALEMLETQVRNNIYTDWWVVYQFPWRDDLRSEPRFQAAMQSIAEKVEV